MMDDATWISGAMERAGEAHQEAESKWVDGALNKAYPWRTMPRGNGVFMPRGEGDYQNLPEGAVYQVPEWGLRGPHMVESHPAAIFASREPVRVESKAFRIKTKASAGLGRAGMLRDVPVDLEYDEASKEWVPKSGAAEEHQARVREAETKVSGNTLGRIGQQLSIGYTDVASIPAQMLFMPNDAADAIANRGAVHDEAVANRFKVGWAERNLGGVAKTAGRMAAVAPLGLVAAPSSALAAAAPRLATLPSSLAMGGTAALPTYQQEFKKAIDKGLTVDDAFNYAALQGGGETLISAVFSAVGLPGAEGMFKRIAPETLKKSLATMGAAKFLSKELAKRGGAEIPEELLTKRFQDAVADHFGIRDAETKTWQSWFDTATQAFLGGGILGSPGAVADVAGRASVARQLKTPEGAAAWAAANPEAAAALAAIAKPSRTDVALATGTSRNAWYGESRGQFVDAISSALQPQAQPNATTPAVSPTPPATPQAAAQAAPALGIQATMDVMTGRKTINPNPTPIQDSTATPGIGDATTDFQPPPDVTSITDTSGKPWADTPETPPTPAIDDTLRNSYHKASGIEIGESVDPEERHTPAVDFYQARGKKVRFFTSPEGAAAPSFTDLRDGTVWLNAAREGDALHQSMAHEYAHGSGADQRLADLPDDVLQPYVDAYLARASEPYRQKLEADPDMLRKEGAAQFMQEVFADAKLRARIRTSNPTLWQAIVDFVRRTIGSAKSKAEQRVIDELAETVSDGGGKPPGGKAAAAPAGDEAGGREAGGTTNPPATPAAGNPNTTGTKNAKTDELRAKAGMEDRPPVEPETRDQWDDEAAKRIAADPQYADRLAADLAANPRAIDSVEEMALNRHLRDLENRRQSGEDVGDEMATAVEAAERVGTIWGRSGVARQAERAADFSLEGIVRQHLRSVNEKPTDEQMARYGEMADRIKALEGERDNLQSKLAQAEVERQIAEAKGKKPATAPKKGTRQEQLQRKVSSAIARFKAAFADAPPKPSGDELGPGLMLEGVDEVGPVTGLINAYREAGVRSFPELAARVKKDIGDLPAEQMQAIQDEWATAAKSGAKPDPAEIGQLARDLTRSVVESGIDQREAVIDAVHKELTGMGVDVTRSQTMEAMSGYGDFRELSKDEISVKVRAINGEIQQLLKLEDMQGGKAPKKTGVERREPTDAERQLIKLVNEAKNRGGYQVTDPAQQLKSALDAAKTAASNRITDLENAIATREKIVSGQTPLKPDAELAKLRDRRDVLNAEYRKIFPPKKTGLSDAARLKMAEQSLGRQIADLKADLDAGRLGTKPKAQPLASPALDAARKELADLKRQREEMRAKSPEYQKQENAKALAERGKGLNRRIAQLQADLDAGRLGGEAKAAPPTSPEIEAKQRQLDALKAVREQARAASPEYQAREAAKQNARYRQSLERQMAFWEQRRDDAHRGKLPEKRKPTPVDDAILEKKYQIELVRRQARAEIEAAERAKRGPAGKALGFGGDLLDLARSVQTGFELSAVLRQGAFYSLGFPRKAGRALANSVRAAFSRRADFAIHDDLMKRPNHADYVRGGLETTADDGPLSAREELLRSRLASWLVQGPGWSPLRWGAEGIKGGERAFRSFLNTMRADLFDYMKDSVEASRPGTWSEGDAKIVGNASNVFSGRAPLPGAVALSRLFFAPRWVWSRALTMAGQPVFKPLLQGNTAAAKAVAKVYVRAALGMGAATIIRYALHSLLAGDDEERKPTIELDPRSSDFGKMRLGETRLDPGTGFNQLVVLAARILTGETKRQSGEIVSLRGEDAKYGADTASDVMTRFLRTKLAPLPSAVWDFIEGKDVVGNKVTPGKVAANFVTPMTWRDIWEAEKELNAPQGTVAAIEAFLGTGLSTHGDRSEYRDADEAGRKEIFEKDLERLEWDSPNPAYSSFLTAEQRKQVDAGREERRQSVVFGGLAEKPERKKNDTDESYRKKLESHQRAADRLEEMRNTMPHEEAQKLLVAYYRRPDENGKKQTERNKQTGMFDKSYWERANRLSEAYGLPKGAWRVNRPAAAVAAGRH